MDADWCRFTHTTNSSPDEHIAILKVNYELNGRRELFCMIRCSKFTFICLIASCTLNSSIHFLRSACETTSSIFFQFVRLL